MQSFILQSLLSWIPCALCHHVENIVRIKIASILGLIFYHRDFPYFYVISRNGIIDSLREIPSPLVNSFTVKKRRFLHFCGWMSRKRVCPEGTRKNLVVQRDEKRETEKEIEKEREKREKKTEHGWKENFLFLVGGSSENLSSFLPFFLSLLFTFFLLRIPSFIRFHVLHVFLVHLHHLRLKGHRICAIG